MHKIVDVTVLDGYKLALTFDDATQGVVDLSAYAGKGVFAGWSEIEEFRAVQIGEFGELQWGDDVDLCPDALYMEATGKKPDEVLPALNREGVNA